MGTPAGCRTTLRAIPPYACANSQRSQSKVVDNSLLGCSAHLLVVGQKAGTRSGEFAHFPIGEHEPATVPPEETHHGRTPHRIGKKVKERPRKQQVSSLAGQESTRVDANAFPQLPPCILPNIAAPC